MTITELCNKAYKMAVEKGFYDSPPSIDQRLMLIVGELAEAHEELRKGYFPNEVYLEKRKPEGFGVEIADAVIRIADMCQSLGIDLERLIELKMTYNATRPYKHGKAF